MKSLLKFLCRSGATLSDWPGKIWDGRLPDSNKVLFIVNKRGGSTDRSLDEVVGRLREGGLDIAFFSPDDPADIGKIIGREADKASAILLGGGDGTFSASAGNLLDAGLPVGVFPLGTANDFARALGIPFDLSGAAEIVLKGHKRAIDVGVVNDRPFLNLAAIGFSADVARHHTGLRKRLLKLFSYPLSWIDAYRMHRPFRAEITCDDVRRSGRFSQIAVGSGRHYGGGMTIKEDAAVDDGWLHLYYVQPRGLWGWLRLLPALRFGTIDRQDRTELLRGKKVGVRTRHEKVVNVDGELASRTPADFHILPKALEVFAPPPMNDEKPQ